MRLCPFRLADVQFSSTPVNLDNMTHPFPKSDGPPLWPSPSMTRIIRSTGSPLDMDTLTTNTPAMCAVSSPDWYTSARKAPYPTPPSVISRWDRNGATSPAQPSHRSSTPPSPMWVSPWDFMPEKYQPGPSNPVAPCHYSSETFMTTPSGLSEGGTAKKICAASTSLRDPLCRGTPQPWLPLGITPSNQWQPLPPQLLGYL